MFHRRSRTACGVAGAKAALFHTHRRPASRRHLLSRHRALPTPRARVASPPGGDDAKRRLAHALLTATQGGEWHTCCRKYKKTKKTGVALLIRHRGHCEPLWAVVPPLQVVLSSACSVASLGRFPSHYLPGRPHLRKGVLADHLFGWGIPSTRQAGHVTVHSASSVKSPCGAQGGMTLPNRNIGG
jgi:hypothetical protein